ncbi:ArsR/SmtB family transcription factor [Serinicoccus hydrothermalis]|uniref:ArsR/SmtB family transcription factor n=1 Tax=Serinicoccus hydrothermalis TaxID=1758689 RepID=UPI000833D9AF|nr:helix-turn-helix domain-containing protein [Serinicoccus hydrothermalis]
MGDIYAALADPTRRLVLDELQRRDGQTLFELCARLVTVHRVSMTRQAISQHISVLESAGLVETARAGRSKVHHFTPSPLREIHDRWPVDPT